MHTADIKWKNIKTHREVRTARNSTTQTIGETLEKKNW